MRCFHRFPEPSHCLECFFPPRYVRGLLWGTQGETLSIVRWNCSPVSTTGIENNGDFAVFTALSLAPHTTPGTCEYILAEWLDNCLQHYKPHRYLRALLWTSDLIGRKIGQALSHCPALLTCTQTGGFSPDKVSLIFLSHYSPDSRHPSAFGEKSTCVHVGTWAESWPRALCVPRKGRLSLSMKCVLSHFCSASSEGE